jgi:hypothetical protein
MVGGFVGSSACILISGMWFFFLLADAKLCKYLEFASPCFSHKAVDRCLHFNSRILVRLYVCSLSAILSLSYGPDNMRFSSARSKICMMYDIFCSLNELVVSLKFFSWTTPL